MSKELNSDLKGMFYEKSADHNCYKSQSRWDMGFDRDPAIHDLIAKRSLEDTPSDTQYGQASRFHNWSLVAESVFG